MIRLPFLAFPLQQWFHVNLPLLWLESLKIISLKLAFYSWEHYMHLNSIVESTSDPINIYAYTYVIIYAYEHTTVANEK